ncbi:CDC45 family, partial [Syncephalis pseudoplumigaleata]
VLRDGPDLPVFAHPLTASQLGLFLLDAMRTTNKKRLPFVLATFCEQQIACLITMHMQSFGIAFHRCADEIRAQVRHDGFDTSVLEIGKDDLEDFIERLHL